MAKRNKASRKWSKLKQKLSHLDWVKRLYSWPGLVLNLAKRYVFVFAYFFHYKYCNSILNMMIMIIYTLCDMQILIINIYFPSSLSLPEGILINIYPIVLSYNTPEYKGIYRKGETVLFFNEWQKTLNPSPKNIKPKGWPWNSGSCFYNFC